VKYIRLPSDRSSRIPSLRELFQLARILSPRRKHIVFALIIFSGFSLVLAVTLTSQAFMVTTPTEGGNFTEGLFGVPRFINPILATSDVDRDLVMLIYSGLLRALPDERFEYDLAQSYTVSDDGLTYTFTLKKDLKWHDGKMITSADIVYTVRMAQNDIVRSPKRASWEGVLVEAIDDLTVQFTLKQLYSPFLDNLTMGILPEHIWKDARPEEFALSLNNIKAIGTGPYKIDKIENDSSGIPAEIKLTANKNFALGAPYISKISLKFFSDETKFSTRGDLMPAKRQVDSVSGLSAELSREYVDVLSVPLPRIFAIFFNQNQSAILSDRNVREALSLATPRDEIIDTALSGFASPIYSPILNTKTEPAKYELDIPKAKRILDDAGWKAKEEGGIRTKKGKSLNITLATGDSPELSRTASLLSERWRELGVNLAVKVYETSDLATEIIRPRKFDALLFGEVVGHFQDPYAFWHTSQRLDPRLNIAGYTNSTADKALEEARKSNDPNLRRKQYKIFENEINKDIPAIFLYQPHFTYISPTQVKNLKIDSVGNASDRFLNVYKWYISTDHVWKIFAR